MPISGVIKVNITNGRAIAESETIADLGDLQYIFLLLKSRVS